MGNKCPPCKKGAPGWMVTFGDMMALLLTFFVLLLSFAQLDIVKFNKMAGSLKNAFGVQQLQQINPTPTGEDLIAMAFTQEVVLVRLLEKLRFVLSDMINNNDAEVVEEEEGFRVRLSNDALFLEDGDTIQLREESEQILLELANVLSDLPNMIHVVGHADALSLQRNKNSSYGNMWALSSAYASRVVDFIVTEGEMESLRFRVVGAGETQPVELEESSTEEDRARNRRTEIRITRLTPPKVIDPVMPTATQDADGFEEMLPTEFEFQEEVVTEP